MDKDSKDPGYLRDKALEYLRKSREVYNAQSEYENKKTAFEGFTKGLKMMFQYVKSTLFIRFNYKSGERSTIS
jgi:hypothetical protein